MSPKMTDPHPPRDRVSPPHRSRFGDDAGFSMVEVLVCLALVAVLIVTVLPNVIAGIKANDAARRSTQMKAIASAEAELMRNLPFHVNPDAGEYIDLFDRYFTNITPAGATPTCTNTEGRYLALETTTSGYVAPGDARCDYELDGPMYRQVRTVADDPDLDGFVVVVNTQFVTGATPPTPLEPSATYNTQEQGRDRPAAAQVQALVSVIPENIDVRQPVTTSTQISRTVQSAARLIGAVDATALEVSTYARNGVPATATAGLISINGSVTSASVINTVQSSVSASTGTGAREDGAATAASAPPAYTLPVGSDSGGSLTTGGCNFICWGGTGTSGGQLSATDGLPNAGTPAAPLQAYIKTPGTSGGYAFQFSAGPNTTYIPSLRLNLPLVRLKQNAIGMSTTTSCAVVDSGTQVRAGADGWFTSTDDSDYLNPLRADGCTTARTAPVAVMPTDFAPDGVVRVQLRSLTARCTVSGYGHTPDASYNYEALVQRWTPSGYVTVDTVTPDDTTDKLAQLNLATTPVGTYGFLGDWIDSWSAVTPEVITVTESDGVAQVKIQGVVNILTRPLRYRTNNVGDLINNAFGNPQVDTDSSMSLTLGAASCTTKDAR